jgi:hypothetical protein
MLRYYLNYVTAAPSKSFPFIIYVILAMNSIVACLGTETHSSDYNWFY